MTKAPVYVDLKAVLHDPRQELCQRLADRVQAFYSTQCGFAQRRPIPKVVVRRARRGRANKTMLTIPSWVFDHKSEVFVNYYVIHEVTHYFAGGGHGTIFKEMEVHALRHWGLKPVYDKAYPRELRDLEGNLLWPWNERVRQLLEAKEATKRAAGPQTY